MNMQNPFIVGRQFRPESFIDREKETAFIVDEISQKGNLVVFGSRRLGKTWLIEKSLHELTKTDHYHCLFFDIQQYVTLSFFVADFVNKLYQTSLLVGKVEMFFKNYLPKSATQFSFSLGPSKIEFKTQSEENLHKVLVEILQIPESLASEKPYLIVFDEFQELAMLDKNVITLFRSQIQHQTYTSYIFAGSKDSAIKDIFLTASSPFFQSMKHLHLMNYLPEVSCRDFLNKQFYQSGKKITPDGIDLIMNMTEGHPLFMQLLARRAWQKTEHICNHKVVFDSLQDELDANQYEYEARINLLRTREQKAVLFSLSRNEKTLYNAENMERYDIQHPNSLTRALLQLIDIGILEKIEKGEYRFTDLFFKEFIRQRFLP